MGDTQVVIDLTADKATIGEQLRTYANPTRLPRAGELRDSIIRQVPVEGTERQLFCCEELLCRVVEHPCRNAKGANARREAVAGFHWRFQRLK